MGSELEVLKKIWENERKASVKLISSQTGLGLDYVRYLCNYLIKRRRIKPVRKKPGWYRITAKGKKELRLLGIFKPKILKEDKGIRKVILPWPKESLKVPRRGAKGKPGSRFLTGFSFRKPNVAKRVKNSLPGKEIPVEEKRLRLGKMIEKTISFLRASTFSAKPKHIKGRKKRRKGEKGKRKKYVKR